MIVGLGSDLCNIERIQNSLDRYGERFIQRVFTEVERAKAERRTAKLRASTYAKRFAAKEAASKALGTGFARGVVYRWFTDDAYAVYTAAVWIGNLLALATIAPLAAIASRRTATRWRSSAPRNALSRPRA